MCLNNVYIHEWTERYILYSTRILRSGYICYKLKNVDTAQIEITAYVYTLLLCVCVYIYILFGVCKRNKYFYLAGKHYITVATSTLY